MLIFVELLIVSLLVSVLVMILKQDGFSVRNRFRKARADGCWGGKDRRQYPRFAESLQVDYSVATKAALKKLTGRTMDVSAGGIKMLLDEKLSPGSFLDLRILLPNPGHTVEMVGEVVWTEDAPDVEKDSGKRLFYSGIKFSSIKEPSSEYLNNHIRSISPGSEI